MIDIGFWELTLSGLVALIILGPQRLPELARTLGTTKARGAASGVTEKPPVTAAGLNAVVSTAMLPVSVCANDVPWRENMAMNAARERKKCFINSES